LKDKTLRLVVAYSVEKAKRVFQQYRPIGEIRERPVFADAPGGNYATLKIPELCGPLLSEAHHALALRVARAGSGIHSVKNILALRLPVG
jgi:hypothetical protein